MPVAEQYRRIRIQSGELVRLSETIIKSYYERKLALLEDALEQELPEKLHGISTRGTGQCSLGPGYKT